MASFRTGRPLDETGEPVAGPVLELDPEGTTIARLRERTSPLLSNPVTAEWVAMLDPEDRRAGRIRTLSMFTSESFAAEHVHPGHDETVEVLEGEVWVRLGHDDRVLGHGDTVTIPQGVPHQFQADAAGITSIVTEGEPPIDITDVVATAWGQAHDGDVSEDGHPSFLQAMVTGPAVADHTCFTSPSIRKQRLLWGLFGPIARVLGYRPVDERYLTDEFWTSRVEQPD